MNKTLLITIGVVALSATFGQAASVQRNLKALAQAREVSAATTTKVSGSFTTNSAATITAPSGTFAFKLAQQDTQNGTQGFDINQMIESIFQYVDNDQDGQINQEEFAVILDTANHPQLNVSEAWDFLRRIVDHNNDGKVNITEFTEFFLLTNAPTQELAHVAWKGANTLNGKILFTAFQSVFIRILGYAVTDT